jgi:hypothetical protein
MYQERFGEVMDRTKRNQLEMQRILEAKEKKFNCSKRKGVIIKSMKTRQKQL